jgi:hypothetical protein
LTAWTLVRAFLRPLIRHGGRQDGFLDRLSKNLRCQKTSDLLAALLGFDLERIGESVGIPARSGMGLSRAVS